MPEFDLGLDGIGDVVAEAAASSWGFGDWLTLGLFAGPDSSPQRISRARARAGCGLILLVAVLAVAAWTLNNHVNASGHEKVTARVVDTYKADNSATLVECETDAGEKRIFRTQEDAVPLIGVTYRFVVIGQPMPLLRDHKSIIDIALVSLNGVQPPPPDSGFLGLNLFGSDDPEKVPMAKGSKATNAKDSSGIILLLYLAIAVVLLLFLVALWH